ncbi:metacaspase-2 [Halyomorpha halys]|uniref:metacaspase-2 n=1 Tax=Halyomorpha halys TaxID=286706 RepID=UPI0006D502FE|nr:MATH and LRR domain-containing protein PFE0570w-like [Halyomorpha halys]
MDTLDFRMEPKSSLAPILNHSTSSEASSVMVIGTISTFENLPIEEETILSNRTTESIGNMIEQLKILRIGKSADIETSVILNRTDLSFANHKNLELSSTLEGIVSNENSDLSILMKSTNSTLSEEDIFRHFYKLNVQPLINLNEALNNTKNNLTLSLQEKRKNSNNFIIVPVKLDDCSKRSSIGSRKNSKSDLINETYNTYIESTLSLRQNDSRENSLIFSNLENEKSPIRCISEKKTLFQTKSDNSKLWNKRNSSFTNSIKNRTVSDLESRKENILKYKIKHCEVKLVDYLVEQETYNGRHIEKNQLIDKFFNMVHNSTKEKESETDFCIEGNRLVTYNGKIDNSMIEKGHVRNNLMKNKQNRSVIEDEAFLHTINNNKENIVEFINNFRKCNSIKSNLHQYVDDTMNESNRKLSNKEKIIIQDAKDEHDKAVNEKNKNEHLIFLKKSNLNAYTTVKTKTKLASNKNLTKNNDKSHNVYSKFGICNKLKFDVDNVTGKMSKTKTILDHKDKIEDRRSFNYESDDSSNLEKNAFGDVSDRVSSRLRKMHGSKLKYTKCKLLPKQMTEEEIKKVVHKITLPSMSSKNNATIKKEFKQKKSEPNLISNDQIGYGFKKNPQNMKYKNQTKTYVKIAEMRKFLISRSSKKCNFLDYEDIIQKVNIAIRNTQLQRTNTNPTIIKLQKLLYEKNICKNCIEFYTFITDFTPFSFQKKVLPLSGVFGCNGPKLTKKLSDPLR